MSDLLQAHKNDLDEMVHFSKHKINFPIYYFRDILTYLDYPVDNLCNDEIDTSSEGGRHFNTFFY